MDLALRFAAKNRSVMMQIATEIVQERLSKHASVTANVRQVVQCHHNYAPIERHYGEEVVVHRKGAIRAKKAKRALSLELWAARATLSRASEIQSPLSLHLMAQAVS